MMHTTSSVDYAVVMSGEIWAIVDTGETLLRAGDVLVQRGAAHAWANRTDKPCLVAFILIGADPVPA
jgi:quercetin dioxygenase-like cupin family protein